MGSRETGPLVTAAVGSITDEGQSVRHADPGVRIQSIRYASRILVIPANDRFARIEIAIPERDREDQVLQVDHDHRLY